MCVCVVPSEVLIHIHAWQRSEVLCRSLSENSLRMLSREKDGLAIELSYFLRYRMFFQSLCEHYWKGARNKRINKYIVS